MPNFRSFAQFIKSILPFLPFWCLAQDIRMTLHASAQMETKNEVTALAFSIDDNFLLAGDAKGNIRCWDFEHKRIIAATQLNSEAAFLSFLRDGKTFVAIDQSGNGAVFSLQPANAVIEFRTRSAPSEIALDTGKRYLAIAAESARIEIYDLQIGKLIGTIEAGGKLDHLLFLGFNRLGEQLTAITERARAISWNPATQRLIREFSLSSNEIHGSKSIIHAASSNRASNIFVVGLQEVALPKGGLKGMAKPTDLVRQNMVLAHDWNSGIEIKRIKFPDGAIKKIVLGPGNDHVAVINNQNNNITLIDLRKGELGGSVTMAEKPRVLAVAETDRWLAAGAEKGKIMVWSLDFRERPTAETATTRLPSLSGRIRAAQANAEPTLPPGVPVTIAILPFQAKGIAQDAVDLCADLMASSLANFSYITLVERNRIQELIKELELQMTGLTEQNGAEIGRLLNADQVILGSIGALGTSYLFNVRILDVETGRVTKGRQVICEECRDQDIYDAVNLLISTIAR